MQTLLLLAIIGTHAEILAELETQRGNPQIDRVYGSCPFYYPCDHSGEYIDGGSEGSDNYFTLRYNWGVYGHDYPAVNWFNPEKPVAKSTERYDVQPGWYRLPVNHACSHYDIDGRGRYYGPMERYARLSLRVFAEQSRVRVWVGGTVVATLDRDQIWQGDLPVWVTDASKTVAPGIYHRCILETSTPVFIEPF